MKQITVTLTVDELRLLATLASDQLFRREFIDPRFPGHKPDAEEVGTGKALVNRLRSLVDQATRVKAEAGAPRDAAGFPRRQNGAPDAV